MVRCNGRPDSKNLVDISFVLRSFRSTRAKITEKYTSITVQKCRFRRDKNSHI